jgi:hypothetical protein
MEVPVVALVRPLLDDPDEPPDDERLGRYLGAAKAAWDEFVRQAPIAIEGIQFAWRYYTDGKAWLCKVARKGRTICWISVREGAFRAAFYFGEKADAGIAQLDIDRGIREAYASAARAGKLKPLRVEVRDVSALPDLFTVMRFKAASA